MAEAVFGIRSTMENNNPHDTEKQANDSRSKGETSEAKNGQPSCPFNMTARNFPKRHRNYVRSAMAPYNRTRASSFSPAKALDLVRAALQPSLNAEISSVLKTYEELFKTGAANIKDNTGEPVTEEHVNAVLRKSLEEAKSLFTRNEPGRVTKDKEYRHQTFIKKRHRVHYKDDSINAFHGRDSKPKHEKQVNHYQWDPDIVNEETEFILGVNANKALGYAATRGKLYLKHPDLFRYVGDQDDKQWLYENKQVPVTGGKAFLMIAEDIKKIAREHQEYRDNESLDLDEIKGFKVSKTMVEKMKAFMRSKWGMASRPEVKKEEVDTDGDADDDDDDDDDDV